MAFDVQPTLETITQEVLILLGEGGQGVSSANLVLMAQGFARRAQAKLYHDARWTFNNIRFTVSVPGTTSLGTTFIDWPDQLAIGELIAISGQRTANPRYVWTLDAGITDQDRAAWNFGGFSTWAFTPLRYAVHDGQIELGPTNTGDTTLTITGNGKPSALLLPNDRCGCDGEALIQLTTILLCNRLGGDYRQMIPELKSMHTEYMRNVKGKQGIAQMTVPGSTWAVDDPARLSNWDHSSQRHWMVRDRRP